MMQSETVVRTQALATEYAGFGINLVDIVGHFQLSTKQIYTSEIGKIQGPGRILAFFE